MSDNICNIKKLYIEDEICFDMIMEITYGIEEL